MGLGAWEKASVLAGGRSAAEGVRNNPFSPTQLRRERAAGFVHSGCGLLVRNRQQVSGAWSTLGTRQVLRKCVLNEGNESIHHSRAPALTRRTDHVTLSTRTSSTYGRTLQPWLGDREDGGGGSFQ